MVCKFNLGIVTFEDATNRDTYNIVSDPETRPPDPNDLVHFIDKQLTNNHARAGTTNNENTV